MVSIISSFSRYMLALALVGKFCSVLFFFLAWWFYRPPGGVNNNAVAPAADPTHEKTNGAPSALTNGPSTITNGALERANGVERSNGYCNQALECSEHL